MLTAEQGPANLCLRFQNDSKASGTVQEKQYRARGAVPFPAPSMTAAAKGEQNRSKTLQMFPLKKSGSQCIRRKITTSAGTTVLNGDIDSNGSITPLLGRAAGMQAVHSISDNVRTTH